jgi:4-amino-4-deoxy-L-arabinose transferase-like glycosyltransferase
LIPPTNQPLDLTSKRSPGLLFLSIAGLSVLLLFRFSVLFFARDAFVEDPDAYRSLAVGLKTSGIYGNSINPPIKPTAFRPPLYPWLLSFGVDRENRGIGFLFLSSIHTLLGVATCGGTAYLCHALLNITFPTLRNSVHRICVVSAALLVALDPILIRQSQMIMTETLATFLSIVTLGCFHRFAFAEKDRQQWLWAFATGIAFGLGSLCRPTAVVWLMLVLVGALFLVRFPYRVIACLLLGSAICILPWGIRNSMHCGKFVLTTTHGGYTLLLANNPSLYDHLDRNWSRDWDPSAFFSSWDQDSASAIGEIERDLLAKEIAWKTICESPLGFVKSSFARLLWLWAPWPNQGSTSARIGIGIWYGIEYLAAILGLTVLLRHLRAHPAEVAFWLPILTLILSISLVHSVFWSNMRMRSVCMPAIAILATLALPATIRHR